MKKLTLIVLSLTIMSFGTLATAADKSDSNLSSMKVGVLNVAQVLQQAPQMEIIAGKMKKKFQPRQEKIAQVQKKLGDDEAKLRRDGSVMAQSERAKLQENIAEQSRQLRRMQEDYMEDVQKAQNQAMETFMKNVNDVVQAIADNEHYDLILQRDGVAFASERVDITPLVVKKLKNKKAS